MDTLFNYFVKAASTYKPDAAVRRGSYAQASDRGQYRSANIGRQGLSKRTAAQLRQTYNLPAPTQQRTTAPVNPSPAPRTTTRTTQPATVAGAPSSKPGSLAKTFAPHIPGVANRSDGDIRSAYMRGSYWDSHRGMGTALDNSIRGNADWQLYNQMSRLGLNTHGANSAQAGAINTALQHLDSLRYGDDAAKYDPLGESLAATQGVSSNATPEELALRKRPFDPSKIRPVMPRA